MLNLDDYDNLLPPHWCKLGDCYINDRTGESSEKNPIQKYFSLRDKFVVNIKSADTPNTENSNQFDQIESNTGSFESADRANSPKKTFIDSRNEIYDYHCQWSDRDGLGKVKNYGLMIRCYSESKTMIKFDGLDAEWIYSSLQGSHGAIEQCDLYIGAKVTVFGRHLTISTANIKAIDWIEKEALKLEKQVSILRSKIEEVGQVPCVKRVTPTVIREISRSNGKAGNKNLRKLKNEVAKLGEQLASLGVADTIIF